MNDIPIAIRVNDMSFFGSEIGRCIFSGVNISIKKGETVVISGPSGCGKTLLLKIISGLSEPASGSITLGGQNLSKLSDKEILKINELSGFVFQDGALISNLNLYDNIALKLRYHTNLCESEINSRIKPWLIQTGLLSHIHDFPAALSINQKKLAGFIRAVINTPEYLYLDEITNNIDLRYFDFIMRTIGNLKKEKVTILFATNNKKVISEISDRVLIVDDGKVRYFGRYNDIFALNDEKLTEILTQNLQ
ncbi:MAG: ATP-binding cassette domain-containing protein [Elusimicrobia bacterium]|nr:ATP-binding cassette domain-containing protein [Elusimicrobiota bacterium]